MEPFEEVKIILSSSQERRRGEPGLKVGEDDKDGHSLDFFLFLPAQLRLRELIGEEEKLQEIDTLTEELIPVSLFNISLPVEERTLLAKKIGSLPPANLKVCKPHLPQAIVDSCLLNFVGPRLVLLFNLLGTSHTFLLEDDWMELPDYFTTAAALKNLSPLKDSCECALALATIVNGKMTRTESSFQERDLVVEKHRKMYRMKTNERHEEAVLDIHLHYIFC